MSATLTDAMTAIDVVRSFFSAYNAHDADRMLSLCSDDAQIRYVPMGMQGQGPAREVGKKIWSGLIDSFPDLSVRAESIFGDGYNIAAEVMIGGIQHKDFLGISNQGRRYDLPHAFLLKLNDKSLITAITAYWDNASFYLQLGKKSLE